MNSNRKSRKVTKVTKRSRVEALAARLERCDGSDDYVAVIRALVATRDPAAIRVLASLLDSFGPIAEESIAGLCTFGEAAIPAMQECTESLDYEMIRHSHRVLAQLGDEGSKQWLRDDNADRIEAYLERRGFSDATKAAARAIACIARIANETDEEEGAA